MNYQPNSPKPRFSLYRWLMTRRIKARETEAANEHYTVTTLLDSHRVSEVSVNDPFVRTSLTIGWYHLLVALLFRRQLTVTVMINADPLTVDYVLEADPDYIGSPARRAAFNAQLEQSLAAFSNED